MFQLATNQKVDEEDLFSGLLRAVTFATKATAHTTLGTTPSQLVFDQNSIDNDKFQANWEAITTRKPNLIDKNNGKENAKIRKG